MDENQFKTNLNSLKELILDEQKLITYVSLSKDLCIHVNDSKWLLGQFIQEMNNNQPEIDLNVSYIISGLTDSNKARITVVCQKDIAEIRKGFKTIFFQHVYSVSKGLPSLDTVSFLAVNKFEDFPLCAGLIKSNCCVKRTSDEIGNLKSNSQVSIQSVQKPVATTSKKTKVIGNKDETIKVHETKSDPIIKAEPRSPYKSNTPKSNLDVKKNGVKPKGIANFFNKSNSAPSKIISKDFTDVKQDNHVKKEKELETIEEKMDIDQEAEKKELTNTGDSNHNRKDRSGKAKLNKNVVEKVNNIKKEVTMTGKSEITNEKPKTKSLNEIKKTAKVDKKRKRLLRVSDSESDDDKDPFVDTPDFEQQVSDDEIPPTPSTNTVKITSGLLNPKKKRKIVDKTYTDEDGYILTKKEEVYESCSDNDEDINSKENINSSENNHVATTNQVKSETSPNDKKIGAKVSKKKVSPPQKGKQSTLMNFFKKV